MLEKSISWQGFDLKISTGNIAEQADAAVWLTFGDTTVLATVVVDKPSSRSCLDFIPLSVEYIEKFYASRRILPGKKREGKPLEQEMLLARLVDRALRPLLPKGLQNEVQVIISLLSHDRKTGVKLPSIIAASAAVMASGLPIKPMAASRVVFDGAELSCTTQGKGHDLSLYVVGTKNKVLSLQGWGKQVPYRKVLDAVKLGMENYKPVIELIESFKVPARKDLVILKPSKKCIEFVEKKKKDIEKAVFISEKKDRLSAIRNIRQSLVDAKRFSDEDVKLSFEKVQEEVVLHELITKGRRIDGRKVDEVRKISGKVGVLPTMHGSCLFSRGETQVLSVLTIGDVEDTRRVDNFYDYAFRSFIFHYNFWPFAVGEANRVGSPSRREIGHGNIAWNAISRVLPKNSPYIYRLVSEVLSSNGSSSMASVCAGSLALMQAGVPIMSPVGGIALGAFCKGPNQYETLVDLLGDEDHLGLMDFKMAGTQNGLTSIQMDVKDAFASHAFLKVAFEKAEKALGKVLSEMGKILKKMPATMPDDVTKMDILQIDRDKTQELTSRVREVAQETSCRLDVVRDSGQVLIKSDDWKNIFKAKKKIRVLLKEPAPKTILEGIVEDVDAKGSFVRLDRNIVGFLPQVLKKGKTVRVMLKGFDRQGNVVLKPSKASSKKVSQV